jgi:hypothetical protein
MNIGIELEQIVNNDVLKLTQERVGGYHTPIPISTYWRIERDGSLRVKGKFLNEVPIEMTSVILKPNNLMKAIEEFKSLFGERELGEVVDFNQSCGCHIHFSLFDEILDFRFKKKAIYGLFKETRTQFFKLLNKSSIIPKDIKEGIKKHYYREYAKKIDENSYYNQHERRMEFNLTCEGSGTGIEWRSFNVRDIQTWEQFREMFRIMLECLENMKTRIKKGCLYQTYHKFQSPIFEQPKEMVMNIDKKEKDGEVVVDVDMPKPKENYSDLEEFYRLDSNRFRKNHNRIIEIIPIIEGEENIVEKTKDDMVVVSATGRPLIDRSPIDWAEMLRPITGTQHHEEVRILEPEEDLLEQSEQSGGRVMFGGERIREINDYWNDGDVASQNDI